MTCPECGERMTGSYDGGEANDYALVVPKCNYCGYVDWDSAESADDEPEGVVYICTKEAPWAPDKGTPAQHPDAKHIGTCAEGCCDCYECPHCGKIWQQENAQ